MRAPGVGVRRPAMRTVPRPLLGELLLVVAACGRTTDDYAERSNALATASSVAAANARSLATAKQARASDNPRKTTKRTRPAIEIVALERAPTGEELDTKPPACMMRSDSPAVVRVNGHRVELTWGGGSDQYLTVSERGTKLWQQEFESDHLGPRHCTRDNWHVVIAGDLSRHAFDTISGERLARVDDVVVAPNQQWALILPVLHPNARCFEETEVFRLPLDGTGPKRALDTPPRPPSRRCAGNEDQSENDYSRLEQPAMAISPDSKLYAYLDWNELSLYDSRTDTLVATREAPSTKNGEPYFIAFLSFTSSGRYLVVDLRDEGELWYEIRRDRNGFTR